MSIRKFDEFGYPCDGHPLDEGVWYYVQKEGLIICSKKPIVTMRWRSVKRALADHEKAKDRRS